MNKCMNDTFLFVVLNFGVLVFCERYDFPISKRDASMWCYLDYGQLLNQHLSFEILHLVKHYYKLMRWYN